MKQLILLFLAFSLLCTPARAQNDAATVYEVADVMADVTADSAAHARDQAIAHAQRSAFGQLLERLGADQAIAAKLSDDDMATLVQSFEGHDEHRSSVRYIGTFTIQFKPNAVRSFLGNHKSAYTEAKSKPVLILPIFTTKDHPVLWEEGTKWRTEWENSAHSGGLVPVILPAGDLDDIAMLSTDEALSGKPDALLALMEKYKAGGAVVSTLTSDAGGALKIDSQHYDAKGTASPLPSINLPAGSLTQAVKQVRAQLEKDWRDTTKAEPKTRAESAVKYEGALTRLPVTVPLNTLAQWAQIERKLSNEPNISRVDVITLARGATSIEIEFQGTLAQLQSSLLQQNLLLTQTGASGTWILQTGSARN